MPGSQDGEDKFCKLSGSDEPLKELGVKQCDCLVNHLQGLDSELWIDACLVHLEYLVQQMFSNVFLLAPSVGMYLIKALTLFMSLPSFANLDVLRLVLLVTEERVQKIDHLINQRILFIFALCGHSSCLRQKLS